MIPFVFLFFRIEDEQSYVDRKGERKYKQEPPGLELFLPGESSLLSLAGENSLLSVAGESSLLFLTGESSLLSPGGERSLISLAGERSLLSLAGETSLSFFLSLADALFAPRTKLARRPLFSPSGDEG